MNDDRAHHLVVASRALVRAADALLVAVSDQDRAHDLVVASRALARAATDLAMIAGVLHETPDAEQKARDLLARVREGCQQTIRLIDGQDTP